MEPQRYTMAGRPNVPTYTITDRDRLPLAGPFPTWRLAACRLDAIRLTSPAARIRPAA
jgi:hypothetical protein